ncbi:DNA replication complex GINS protein PSF3 [Nilaparvata lugens]|uniref:DNA replication complex GINS protein PSF3 n=1 Tax=Nilaparvata lugens TaxID=108931 RepID=UPI000B97D5F0|nr:DNA replication complex GINS protein PSF3 [Nilaparvata lugens]
MLPWRNCKKHYFSIEEILASQEKVPCTFRRTANNLGILDPSAEDGIIQRGAVVEIPLWLAKTLSRTNHGLVRMQLPKIYKDVYRDSLVADASVVDLYKMSKFFYSFGKQLSDCDEANSKELRNLLTETFKNRFRQLMAWVQNMSVEEVITEKLDTLERKLLVDGRNAQNRLNNWLSNRVETIQAADMVMNHSKKRKFSDLDV